MKIDKIKKEKKLTLAVSGSVDAKTAETFYNAVKESINGVEQLTVDFKGLEYLSSAGLRVLLDAQKIMNKQGKMKIINCNDDIMEIFKITGFDEILNIL